MKVLIAKENQELFKKLLPSKKFKFEEASVNTSSFTITEKLFIKLRNEIRAQGYNPFALMYWYW